MNSPLSQAPLTEPVATGRTADAITAAAQAWESRLADAEKLAAQLVDESHERQFPRPDYFLPGDFVLSIAVPAFNEQATIALVIDQLLMLPFNKEIIVVDDASTDATRDVLAALSGRKEIKILHHPANRGKGAAIRTALQSATGDVVVIQDADLEYNPRDLIGLLKPLATGDADVVYGSRFLQAGKSVNSSALHRLGNWLLTYLSNCVCGLRLTDMETCYKATFREIIQGMKLEQDRFGFEPEITAKLAARGLRFVECPVTYQARDWSEGKKIGWRDAITAVWCIARYRFRW